MSDQVGVSQKGWKVARGGNGGVVAEDGSSKPMVGAGLWRRTDPRNFVHVRL